MEIDYKDHGKKPYIINIEDATTGNDNYRTTIWTGSKLQVTVMSIQPGDDIGLLSLCSLSSVVNPLESYQFLKKVARLLIVTVKVGCSYKHIKLSSLIYHAI